MADKGQDDVPGELDRNAVHAKSFVIMRDLHVRLLLTGMPVGRRSEAYAPPRTSNPQAATKLALDGGLLRATVGGMQGPFGGKSDAT